MNVIDEMHAERAQKEQDFLDQRIVRFLHRYRPEDERDASQFEADLIGLIRMTHMQAVEPFNRRLADAVKLMPTFPFTPEKKP